MKPGEFGFLEWIHARDPRSGQAWDGVSVGPGDDCAVVQFGGREVLITTDALLLGTHVTAEELAAAPERVGWKLLAVSLSDVAAMGGLSRYAVACVGLPRGYPAEEKQGIVRGLHRCAETFGVAVVGGDVTAWPREDGPLALSLTLLGEMPAGDPPVAPIRRSGARAGDAVYVSGALGGSRLGRHLDVTPRAALGPWLAEQRLATSMIDLSDGLSRDIGHLCDHSGLGVEIDAAALPIHPDVAGLGSPEPAWRHALNDGEDFELCWTVSPETASAWGPSTQIERVPATLVGRMVDQAQGRTLRRPDGVVEPLIAAGWEHA